MATKINHRVNQVLNDLVDLDPGKNLTLISNGNHFKIYHGDKQVGEDLILADLKNISRHSTKLGIVQLVDVSHLVYSGQVKNTDAYLKVEDDIAKAFLHLVHKMKFQKPDPMATPKMEVAI